MSWIGGTGVSATAPIGLNLPLLVAFKKVIIDLFFIVLTFSMLVPNRMLLFWLTTLLLMCLFIVEISKVCSECEGVAFWMHDY